MSTLMRNVLFALGSHLLQQIDNLLLLLHLLL
jgi:hypothetical protein